MAIAARDTAVCCHSLVANVDGLLLWAFNVVSLLLESSDCFASEQVATSSHPGRTKTNQTHFMTPSLKLCDVPGLVWPRWGVLPAVQVFVFVCVDDHLIKESVLLCSPAALKGLLICCVAR